MAVPLLRAGVRDRIAVLRRAGGPSTVLLAAAVASCWLVLGGLLATMFTFSFRTNDDIEMLTYVSGMGGGPPDAQLAFTSSLIGTVLVRLYRAVPDAPWYGLYLHGLQMVGLTMVGLALALVRHRLPPVASGAVVGAVVAVAANAIVAVQFTIVASLLGAGAVALLLALHGQGRLRDRHAVGLGLVLGVAGLVRVQSLVLVVAVTLGIVAILRILRVGPTIRVIGTVLVVAVAVAAGGLLVDQRVAEASVGGAAWRDDLGLSITGLTGAADPFGYAERRLGALPLSDNDVRMMEDWITPDATFLQIPLPPPDAGAAAPDGPALLPVLLAAVTEGRLPVALDDVMLHRWWPPVAFGALVIGLLSLRRRAAVAGVTALASIVAGAVLLASVARYPERVGLGVLLMAVVLPSIAAAVAVGPSAEPPAPRPVLGPAARVLAGALVAVMLVAAEVPRVQDRSDETDRRLVRAERALADLEVLRAAETERPVVALWLADVWQVVGPLEWGGTADFPDRAAEIAGWGFPTPFRTGQRAELGLSDWIGAVADDDGVWLIADPEVSDRIRIYLRERRGRLCTEAVLAPTMLADRWYVFKQFEDVLCTGQVVG